MFKPTHVVIAGNHSFKVDTLVMQCERMEHYSEDVVYYYEDVNGHWQCLTEHEVSPIDKED